MNAKTKKLVGKHRKRSQRRMTRKRMATKIERTSGHQHQRLVNEMRRGFRWDRHRYRLRNQVKAGYEKLMLWDGLFVRISQSARCIYRNQARSRSLWNWYGWGQSWAVHIDWWLKAWNEAQRKLHMRLFGHCCQPWLMAYTMSSMYLANDETEEYLRTSWPIVAVTMNVCLKTTRPDRQDTLELCPIKFYNTLCSCTSRAARLSIRKKKSSPIILPSSPPCWNKLWSGAFLWSI